MQSNEGFHETKEPMTFNIAHILMGCVNNHLSLFLSLFISILFKEHIETLLKKQEKWLLVISLRKQVLASALNHF